MTGGLSYMQHVEWWSELQATHVEWWSELQATHVEWWSELQAAHVAGGLNYTNHM